MLERSWGKENTPPMLMGVEADIVTLEICMTISQKIRKQRTSTPSNTTFGYKPKGCSIVSQGHVLNYVNSSIICHNRNLEIT